MNKFIFVLSLLIFGLSACNSEGPEIIESRAVVIDAGNPEADGCGWLINIDGLDYSPTYLNSQYHQDGLEVLVKVEYLSSDFSCGLSGTEIQQIRLIQIRPF